MAADHLTPDPGEQVTETTIPGPVLVKLKAYAGSAPVTRASGRSLSVSFRRIKNDRLAAAGWIWALAAMANHEPAAAHYRRRRDRGDRHTPALRNLFNRQLGQLCYCLQTSQYYDPIMAFPTFRPAEPMAAGAAAADAGPKASAYSSV